MGFATENVICFIKMLDSPKIPSLIVFIIAGTLERFGLAGSVLFSETHFASVHKFDAKILFACSKFTI